MSERLPERRTAFDEVSGFANTIGTAQNRLRRAVTIAIIAVLGTSAVVDMTCEGNNKVPITVPSKN